MIFANRGEAGLGLARRLERFASRQDVIVLGVPRGGVPVAYEIASALHAPLDVLVLRKLGVPGHEELAFGAIALGGMRVLDRHIIQNIGISPSEVDAITAKEHAELLRRESAYRGHLSPLALGGKTVILVDDGVATGASLLAGIRAVRAFEPAKTVVAVPVAPPETCERLADEVDDLVCIATPERFGAVGQFYDDFSEVCDEEVIQLLTRHNRALAMMG